MRSHPRVLVAAFVCTLPALRLPAQADWQQLTPASSPGPRIGHAMAYDAGNDRVVLFGGADGPSVLGETWEWDGSSWAQVFPPTQPTARRDHALVWYPPSGTVVLYGGDFRNDLWQYDGVDWSPVASAHRPPPRVGTQVEFDPAGGGLVLFSGYFAGPDTWYFDGVDWGQRLVPMPPPERFDHQMTADPLRQRVVLWGGTGVADTWEWDGAGWLDRQPSTLPTARFNSAMAYDLARDRVILYGGMATTGAIGDTWAYGTTAMALHSTYGGGCVGSNNLTPRITSAERPWIGETFHAAVEPLVPGAATVMFAGFSSTTWAGGALPYGLAPHGLPGCQLLVEPLVGELLANAGGAASWSLPVPNDTGLVGVAFYHQAFTLDPGAPGGAAVSDAGAGTIGVK